MMRLRCSQLPSFEACRSSALPCDNPYNPGSDAATLGTAVHDALAQMVRGEIPDLSEVAGRYELEESDLCGMYDVGRDYFEHACRYTSPDAAVHVEQPMESSVFTGTPDVLLVGADMIVVVDWKTGRNRYDALAQLRGYLSLAGEKYGPRANYVAVVAWLRTRDADVYTLKQSDMDAWHDRIEAWWDEIGKQYAPGEACRYCKRQMVCDARREYIQASAMAVATQETQLYTPELLGRLWSRAKTLKQAMKAYDDAVRMEVTQRGYLDLPDGKRLVLRDYSRDTFDPKVAWSVLTSQYGFNANDMQACLNVNATMVKRIVRQRAPRGEKAAEENDALQAIRDFGGARTVTHQRLVVVRGDGGE